MPTAASKTQRRVRPWMIALLLVVFGGILLASYFAFTRREMSILLQGLRPAEASAVVDELEAQSIPYELADGGATILAPSAQRDSARLKLAGADLHAPGQEGFELFDTSDLGLTEFAQRIKYQRALQGELTRTIMKIDGVLEARIHIFIPERSTFRSERSPAKAAVTLLTRSPEIETVGTIAGIQQLVASSIADLAAEDVVVLNGRGTVISPSPSETPIDPVLAEPHTGLLSAVTSTLPVDVAPFVQLEPASNAYPSSLPGHIRILTNRPLDADERDQVLAAIEIMVTSAGGAKVPVSFDLKLGGIDAPTELKAEPVPVALPQAAEAPATNAADAGDDVVMPLIVATIVLVLLAIIIVITNWRRPLPRLSIEDQQRFAERLRIGLQSQRAEATDGAS